MAKSMLTALVHLQTGLQSAKEFAGEVATAAAAAIEEIDNEKMAKTGPLPITIPTTGWTADSSDNTYTYRYDIATTGVTAVDLPVVIIAPGSMAAAQSAGFSPVCETFAGIVRIRSKTIPASAILAELRIFGGV